MAKVEHERLGEILGRGRGSILAYVVLRFVFPFKIPVMRCAEGFRKAGRSEQATVGVSDCVGELVSKNVAQGRVAPSPDIRKPRKRNTRDADVARAAIPLPAVGKTEWNQIGIHSLHVTVEESLRGKLACHGGGRTIKSGLGYEVHVESGGELRVNDGANRWCSISAQA